MMVSSTIQNEKTRRKYNIQKTLSNNGSVKPSDINTDVVSNQIFLMGDSVVKQVRGYEISRKVKNCKVYLKSFLGAKVMCIEDYVQPTLRELPTHIILHVGTRDLPIKKILANLLRILLT